MVFVGAGPYGCINAPPDRDLSVADYGRTASQLLTDVSGLGNLRTVYRDLEAFTFLFWEPQHLDPVIRDRL